jgi:urease accessory protein
MRVRLSSCLATCVTAAAMAPLAASAHEGHEAAGGLAAAFAHGLAHPFSGLDHLLAMLLVGFWAADQKHAKAVLPIVFLLGMALGGGLSAGGLAIAFAEAGVAATLVLLGGALFAAWRIGTAPAAALCGLAGVLHGYAHVSDAGAQSLAWLFSYGAGFVFGTVVLLAAGAVLWRLGYARGARPRWPAARPAAGLGVAAAGLVMLLA